MGVAGLISERHPPSLEKQYNFCRYTNDITMTFWYIYWFQSFKKSQEPRSPFLKGSMDKLTSFFADFHLCPSASCTPVVPITSDTCIQNSYSY